MLDGLVKDNAKIKDNDGTMAFLKDSIVDDEEYLRYRITHHFNNVIKSLYDEHKKDTQTLESESVLNEMRENIQLFLDSTSPAERKRFDFWCKQADLDSSELTDDECKVLMSAIEKSKVYKRVIRQYK